MSSTLCLNDGSLGPSVHGCRGDFDFTQKFERIFLSIIPAAIFVSLSLARVAVLSQSPRIVEGRVFQYFKVIIISIYSIIQFSLLVLLAAGHPGVVHGLSVAASALVFFAALFSIPLSFAEHERAKRPSTLLNVYVLLTLLFDVVQARTAWLVIVTSQHDTLARLFTLSVAIKAIILCLEAVPKTRWIQWKSEEHSPEESSSIFSLGVYFWLNALFMRGYKTVLDADSLYPLDEGLGAHRLYEGLASKLRIHSYNQEGWLGSLLKDLCRALPGPFLIPIAPRVALIAFKFCQPFFIDTTLEYLGDKDSPANHGYGLIGACVLIYTGVAVSSALYNYYNQKAVFAARGCLAAAIYRKTTEAKLSAADNSAALTLMSTDIERIVKGGQFVHDVWANVIEVAIGCWLLQTKIGVAFVAPLIVIAVCAAGTAWLLTVIGKKQAEWMERIQNRVGLTANAITHMKLYKISGITTPVADLIQTLRVGEAKVGNQFRWLLIFAAIFGYSPQCIAPIVTFAVTSSRLDVNTLFTSLSYIILVTAPLGSLFQNLPFVFAAQACLRRIQDLLVAEPRIDFRTQQLILAESETDSQNTSDHKTSPRPAFTISNGSFGWGGDKKTLNQINTTIPTQQLTLVVGPVASGKSTFCKVLLGEVSVSSGVVKTHFPPHSIGYCEQTPFLYNATFRENIIGHCQFDQKKYNEIIDATMLSTDVALLPHGHDTKIGSNGIMLSGGQRQRVSVARALYSDANVMIFDDILSGLDNDTEAELFRRVFGPNGLVRRRGVTVIICTHSVRNLPSADHIIALGVDGTIVEEGTFETLMKNNKYVQSLGVKNSPVLRDESEEEREEQVATSSYKPQSQITKKALEEKARQQGDWTIYKHYFGSVRLWMPAILASTGLLYGVCNNLATIWMKFWADDTFDRSASFYIGIIASLKIGQMFFLSANAFITLIVMISFSGNVLHQRAINTVVSAPLKFFTTTDSGVVTNLFSQDMTLLDGDLPSALTNVLLDIFDTIGMAFVIASASPFLAIGYPILFAVLFFVQKFYLCTSRQLRLLDLEAKSPLYTHYIDTMKGIATIRAFGWQNADIERNNKLVDDSQRPAYLLAMIQQWLMSTLQLITAGLAVLLIGLATQLRTNTGLTGASLVTLLSFTEVLSSLIRSYTALETSIGAVRRLRTFSETVKPEDRPGEDVEPPLDWPQGGRIDVKDVSASYDGDELDAESPSLSNMVLQNLDLTVLPGQKVAICGRTGSGKSSLILLLLRLLDPLPHCAANMEIDGVPFHRIDRSTLRKRIIAIPQDAVFLPDGSTVRSNIDPLEIATDEECLAVLHLVQLSGFVEDRGRLGAGMNSDELSAGQKQLFSLGRAILRKRVRDRLVSGDEMARHGGLLLLDEVSSSVDKVTDRAMQEIIKDEFEAYTIIMVSHRLEMVVDFFDSVVVLDKGVVVETGSPKDLINSPGSRFGELWAIGNHESSS